MDWDSIQCLYTELVLIKLYLWVWDSIQYSYTALVLNAVISSLLVLNSTVTAIFTELDTFQHLYTDSVLFQLYLLFGTQFGTFTLN